MDKKFTPETVKPMAFIPRFFGAFGQFFRYLGGADYAARCQAISQGELFAFEVEPKVIYEEVELIREIPMPSLTTTNADGAYQVLQLLQQEARFIDFTQENLTQYSDEDVGAAARQIHIGCAKVLAQFFTISSVATQAENTPLTLPVGYNPKEYKLEGRIEGTGPFSGTLIHAGWKVDASALPQISSTEALHILAPAEVEV